MCAILERSWGNNSRECRVRLWKRKGQMWKSSMIDNNNSNNDFNEGKNQMTLGRAQIGSFSHFQSRRTSGIHAPRTCNAVWPSPPKQSAGTTRVGVHQALTSRLEGVMNPLVSYPFSHGLFLYRNHSRRKKTSYNGEIIYFPSRILFLYFLSFYFVIRTWNLSET